jgi:DNA-binding IclR family transcriptional regulator
VSEPIRTGTPLNRSIGRAARMLGLFSPEEPELALSSMTSRLDINKATAHRYALALRHAGLLRYDASRQLYSLGPRIVELAASALAGLHIIKIAGPHMERLMARVNETVVMSVWNGESPVVVRVEDNTDRIVRIVVRIGSRLPITSAQGKVFRAFGTDTPPRTVPQPELADVRATRIAVNSQVVQGVRAIATPVFQDTELVSAMAIVGTSASVPEGPGSELALALRQAAEALSAELGFLSIEAHATERRFG